MKNYIKYWEMKYPLSVLILSVFLAIGSCSSQPEFPIVNDAAPEDFVEGSFELSKIQFESSGMELGKLEIKPFYEVIHANGIIDVPPEYRASIGSYFGGTVKEIRLITGERVEIGQSLFTLENPDFIQIQQDYLEAKGQISYLKSDYERQKNLAEGHVSSQKKFLKAESDYLVTKVKMESIAKKLILMNINPDSLSTENIRTTINITSPMKGFVTQVNIARGTFLSPTQSAIDLVNTEHLHLELNVFANDLPKIHIDQAIDFKIQEDRSKKYRASVYMVNKIVDPVKRTIGVHGHLMDKESTSRLSPGMYVEAEIYSEAASKAALPENAVVEIDGGYYVLTLVGKTDQKYSLEQKEIRVGENNNGFIEILNPLDFDRQTQFLTRGAFHLIQEES